MTLSRLWRLVALLVVVATPAAAFTTQGVVTGRIYDELASNDTAMRDFYDLGLGYIRIEFEEFRDRRWATYSDAEVLRRRGQYQTIIQKARDRGIKVLGIVNFNSFPDPGGFPDTDASLQAYVDSVRWHLQNYAVDAVEIWNEPGNNGLWAGKLGRYGKMLVMTYSQLKPSYPSRLFVGPTTVNAERGDWLGYHGTSFVPENSIFNCAAVQTYRNNNAGRLPLDVISWHPYGSSTSASPNSTSFYYGQTFATYYTNILNYTDRANRKVVGSTPIWFTEYGWSSVWAGAENQRIFQEQMIALINARPQIQVPFWYSYRDDEAGGEGKTFGLRRNSGGGFAAKRVYYPFMAHSNLVGLATSDGYNEWTVDEIINKYVQAGGRAYVGHPWNDGGPWYGDKVHYWGPNNNGFIQNFTGGAMGVGAITVKIGSTTGYLLKGGFWTHYKNNGGPYAFGWPITDEYVQNGYVIQQFELGYFRWRSGEAVTFIRW